MPSQRDVLRNIHTFPQLIKFLRDELDWPIESDDFEELTFDYTPEELGIDAASAAKIEKNGIKRLRPLSANQPWGIFFVKFEPKRLPVVALRRVLSRVVLKKRASANSEERAAWQADDLLFISNYGEGDERQISFAHFSTHGEKADLPTLKVLGWDNRDTPLHLDDVADTLHQRLAWPEDDKNAKHWREQWRSAFTLRHLEVITTSKDLAVRLAELARAIHDRIRTVLAIETEKGPVTKLMKAFQEALIHDLSADEFSDMYAQTIAYGLLSARVANPEHDTADAVATHIPVTNPFLKELMETFLHLGGRKRKARGGNGIDFDELGVSEVVELLDAANMEAVVRDFGDRNRDEDPVIHFYELFLKEYDAKKRMQRGVFYTPQPVVSYIVRSVHELLQTEFGLEDGLASTVTWGEMAAKHAGLKIPDGVSPADPFVVILDPATGTATFLVEAIDVIYRTVTAKWQRQRLTDAQQHAAWNEYVPKYLLPRLHGFELMMAPYAIAHMKIGLKLYETRYRFGSEERARIYLTNALEPASDDKKQREFEQWAPALAHEARAVNAIKRNQRFTVVIGNPPYANFGQLNKIAFILDLLEDYKRGLGEKKLNLDDDYLKFLRLAQYTLACSGAGILGMITNSSFLDGLVHRKMRESLLAQFTDGWIGDLHGNSRRGDTASDGSSDENVFDIQQGVAISVWIKCDSKENHRIRYCEQRGSRESKYGFLGAHAVLSSGMNELEPRSPEFFFIPQNVSRRGEYEIGIPLREVFSVIGSGLNTDRDDLCIDFDKAHLSGRMQKVFSGRVDADFIEAFSFRPSSSYDPVALAKRQTFDPKALRICIYRPFDLRHIYYKVGFTSRPVFEVQGHMLRPNMGLLVCRQSKEPFAVLATRNISTHKIVAVYDRTSLAPLWLYHNDHGGQRTALKGVDAGTPSFTPIFAKALADRLQLRRTEHGLPEGITPEVIFHYVYAVFHSPGYRSRYGEFLKVDFPRLPLTGNLELFRALARLGGELVALHLLESPRLDRPITTYTGPANPEVEKITYARDTVWLDKEQTRGFRGVPEAVWDFHIGGYRVCEKWLKDRKGRTLSKGDIAHYHKVVVALGETIRLMQEIDEVIEAHGGWPGAFSAGSADSSSLTEARV